MRETSKKQDLSGIVLPANLSYFGVSIGQDVIKNIDRVLSLNVGRDVNLRYVLERFTKMVEEDALIGHCVDLRNLIIRSFNYELQNDSADANAKMITEFVRRNIFENINFDSLLEALLQALTYGFVVIEKVFEVIENKLMLVGFKSPYSGYFAFSKSYELLYYPDGAYNGQYINLQDKLEKFVVWSYNSKFDNPYGKSILDASLYYLYLFRKEALKAWYVYAIKFGAPVLYGVYDPVGIEEKEKHDFADLIGSIRTGLNVAIPNSLDIKSVRDVEQHKGYEIFNSFWKMSSMDIANRLIFQSMSAEGDKYGSYAKNKVYQNVMEMAFSSDAQRLADVVNEQVIKHLVDYNFGQQRYYPYINFSVDVVKNMETYVRVLDTLMQHGLEVPEDFLREYFHIPPANDRVVGISKDKIKNKTGESDANTNKKQVKTKQLELQA